MTRFIFYSSVALLMGCTSVGNFIDDTFNHYSLSRDECRVGNWENIGLMDGARGRDLDYFNQHVTACAREGITPDINAWKVGRERGLADYCTPDHAYNIGLRGITLASVCPQDRQTELFTRNYEGRQLHTLRTKQQRLQQKRMQLRREIEDLEDGIVPDNYIKRGNDETPDSINDSAGSVYLSLRQKEALEQLLADPDNLSWQDGRILQTYIDTLEDELYDIDNDLEEVQTQLDALE